MFRVKQGKLRYRTWAAWLGLLALALNALVPVHLAFDLAEALGTARTQSAHTKVHSAEWRLLALLTDHREADGKSRNHGKDRRTACPVCSALGTLAGFTPTAPPMLSLPVAVAIVTALPLIERDPPAPVAAYRSRAPPLA